MSRHLVGARYEYKYIMYSTVPQAVAHTRAFRDIKDQVQPLLSTVDLSPLSLLSLLSFFLAVFTHRLFSITNDE